MQTPITVSTLDADRIETLLDTLPSSSDHIKEALRQELARAELVEPEAMPPDIVTMHSRVRFEIEETRETFCLTLAYPRDMGTLTDGLSILTPIGTALLGLSKGAMINWPRLDGQLQTLRILDIAYQPERAGVFAL